MVVWDSGSVVVGCGGGMVVWLCSVVVTYAVVDPGAVVVEYLDAVVADTAVTAPWRPIELTGDTPFHANLKRI